MEVFILLGAGLLGAAFFASQSPTPVSVLWKALLGGSGGLLAWFLFDRFDSLPAVPSVNGFIMMFVLGAVAGGFALHLFLFLQRKIIRQAH